MTSRAQTNRSTATGNRPPTTRPVGEFYVNFADNQLGVIDPTPAARDLLPIRTHAPTASFGAGDLVSSGGRLYRAKAVMSPKPFAYADWLGLGSDIVNVMDFGAKIDGTTLDGASIGAALAALKPQQSVFLPGGQSNFLWSNVQGTTPATPVLFRLDGTTNPGGQPFLRAFSRKNKGDVFETFSAGLKYFSKRDPEKDSQGVLSIEHLNDDTTNDPGTNSLISIPMRVTVRDNVNAKTSMWGVHVAMDSYSNQSGWPQNVGISSSVIKHGAAWLSGIHVTSQDSQQKNSLDGGAALLGMELGHHADLADNAFNGGIWGSTGLRQGIGVRQSAVNTGLGLAEFSCSFIGGSDFTSITKSVYIASSLGYAYQVFDARGPTPPPSYTGPIAGLRMAHEQAVDFNGGPQLDSAAGNYLQYTTASPARLRYMDGAAELWAISDAGTWSGSSFGTAIGKIPVFQNYQNNTGFSSLAFASRFIVSKSGTTSDADYATMNIIRTTTHSGGNSGAVATALRVNTVINTGVTNQEWAFLSQATAVANTSAGAAVGGDMQGIRQTNSTVPIWGGIFNAIDQSGGASSAYPGAVLAGEIDVRASGADDGLNAAVFGGKGLRMGLQFVIVRQSTTVPLEVSHGVWFSANELTQAKYFSAIGFANGTQTYQALDTRGAVSPDANPVAAVRMLHDQIIDFAGGPALNSAPGNYLQYTTSGTARLHYMVGAGEAFWVDNSGNMAVAGTLNASNISTPGTLNVASLTATGTVTGQTLHSKQDLTVDRDISATGNLTATAIGAAASVSATGSLFAAGANIAIGPGGSGRIMQMQPQYYFDFNTGNGDMVWFGNNTAQWYMRAFDGTCFNSVSYVGGHGAYHDLSDERLKTDITPATVGLPEILAIEPINFHRLGSDGEPRTRDEIGFSAQQVQPIIPEAVTEAGIGLPDGLALAAEMILAAAVNAIKTLNQRVSVLEAL